jgi:hypothetical protein
VELELLVNKQQTRGSWAERAAEAAAPAKTTGRAPCSQHSALSSGCALSRAGCLRRNVPVSEAADHAPLDGRRVGEAEGAALSRKGEPCCPPHAFGAKCRRSNEQARVDLGRAGGALVSATRHAAPRASRAPPPSPTHRRCRQGPCRSRRKAPAASCFRTCTDRGSRAGLQQRISLPTSCSA